MATRIVAIIITTLKKVEKGSKTIASEKRVVAILESCKYIAINTRTNPKTSSQPPSPIPHFLKINRK